MVSLSRIRRSESPGFCIILTEKSLLNSIFVNIRKFNILCPYPIATVLYSLPEKGLPYKNSPESKIESTGQIPISPPLVTPSQIQIYSILSMQSNLRCSAIAKKENIYSDKSCLAYGITALSLFNSAKAS